jgi:hypothetical protein
MTTAALSGDVFVSLSLSKSDFSHPYIKTRETKMTPKTIEE